MGGRGVAMVDELPRPSIPRPTPRARALVRIAGVRFQRASNIVLLRRLCLVRGLPSISFVKLALEIKQCLLLAGVKCSAVDLSQR